MFEESRLHPSSPIISKQFQENHDPTAAGEMEI